MATLDLPEQIAALEAMRAELEVALDGDENWRALRRGGAPGDDSPERRDRDARLAKALEANPLYLAWAHIDDAVEALREADDAARAAEVGELNGGKAEAPWPEEEEAGEVELPHEIRERIRADADGDETPGQSAESSESRAELAATDASQQADTGAVGSKLASIPSLEPIAAPRMEFSDRLHKLEADVDELNEALEAPSPAIPEPPAEASAEQGRPVGKVHSAKEEELAMPDAPETAASESTATRDAVDKVHTHEPAEEAKVTFVKRRSPLPAATAAESPAQTAAAGDGFVPLAAAPQEAEVTIVKPEDPATAPVKRFLKALSGD